MKIRSLLLGSVAAAGLSTGAFAADLGVLTSLDVCDALGLSGLTISSDTNCLQITGEVKYNFTWGDYNDEDLVVDTPADGGVGFFGGDGYNDFKSKFDAYIKFVATADSDFGPAKAVLKLREKNYKLATGGYYYDTNSSSYYEGFLTSQGSGNTGLYFDEAYVSIGDSTVIMAGKKGSIMNKADDEPLNWLGLFNSEDVDTGVSWGPYVELPDGGHVIQVTSDLGNGVSVSAGLENLDGSSHDWDLSNEDDRPGTAVGVIAYSGEGISAHLTGAIGGILDGDIDNWGVHAGFTGTFDNFKVVLAGAYGHNEYYDDDYWNVLASASATFDIFTIAASFEAVDYSDSDDTDFGAGASITAAVAEGVTLNVGGRWFHYADGDVDNFQVAASVSAAVTESITLTGEVGYVDGDYDSLFYGSAKLAWAPGGGYTSSIKGTVNSGTDDQDVGYKIETEFKKTFE
ncbi:hypothetical protein [Devosia sp. CN2-171]|uniref:hypothetical protein n=1 Tax=Devosia sp. CN2-171 TaxID=3400909 RepID=UPI003BF80AF5